MDKASYKKLLLDNVTAHYKLAEEGKENEINNKAKSITENLEICDRIEPIAKKQAYITLKDHKKEFPNVIKCRLINPTKSNIGKISKQILQSINGKLRNELKLKQWRSTNETLTWFKNLIDKDQLQFIQLDIVDFYPSINEELFNKAIKFAEKYITITDQDKDILQNARQSLLYHDNRSWHKKTGLFDVTMGSYDGCELCELVGLLIIHTVREKFPNINFGLYRDDGLGAHKKLTKSQLNRIEKSLHATFKSLGLAITVETSKHTVDFLDVTLNLQNNTFSPYRKENDTPLYIHRESNHPPHIAKQLPISINKRLNDISCNKEVFDNAKDDYEKALKESKLKNRLKFENQTQRKKRPRKRKNNKQIWFTPPFCAQLSTKLGREFLNLIDKHFPITNTLHKIFNRRTIKLSFSVSKNMETIIQDHNKRILSEKPQTKNKLCNCRDKDNCPVQNKCQEEKVIYKAIVTTNDNTEAEYIGCTTTTFKERYANHKKSISHERYQHETALSTFIWANNLQQDPKIKWEIVAKSSTYQPGNKTCQICVLEKFYIIEGMRNKNSLNKKTDVGNKCIHRRNATFAYSVT